METRQENKGIDPMLVLGKAVDMSVKVRGGDFPLGALPMKIQRIVREANDCYGYPVDYLAVSVSATPISPGSKGNGTRARFCSWLLSADPERASRIR
jgi:hypothetical protein